MNKYLTKCGRNNLLGFHSIGLICLILLVFTSCRKPDLSDAVHHYPEEIAPLLRNNCAISGCHESTSAAGAGGLNLDTWEDLFKGARGGSPVVPYNPEQSYILQALSTDSNWVPALYPTMPLGGEPYGALDLQKVIDWIAAGARNAEGEERFPPQTDRTKWYVLNRTCDQVAVFDAESRQVMRMIEVGSDDIAIEEGFDLIISPDQQHWYICYLYWNPRIEVYSTLSDEKEAEIWLDRWGYSHMAITPDGSHLVATSNLQERISVVDLNTRQVVFGPHEINDFLEGLAIHPQRDQVYFGSGQHEYLYTMDYDAQGQLSNQQTIDLEQHIPSTNGQTIIPHDIVFLPDASLYFVTCIFSREVRVFNGSNDSLITSVPVRELPRHIAVDEIRKRIFVTCETETALHGGAPLKMGVVSIIDYENFSVEKEIYTGFQPYGIDIDPNTGVAVVAHRNQDLNAPPSHHGTTCEGQNGNVTLIDLNSLEIIPDYKAELSVDPFCVAVKH